jgi:hypothetical protein
MTLTKHFIIKKLMLTFVATSILTLSTGCSKASNDQSQAPSSTQGGTSQSPSTTDTQKQDQDLTKKLTSEKIVDSGQVYMVGNDIVAVIVIKKGTDQKTAKDLTTKYANTMKKKYKNKKVNSHAFIEGKEVAHITL